MLIVLFCLSSFIKGVPNLGHRVSIFTAEGVIVNRFGAPLPGEEPDQFLWPHGKRLELSVCWVCARGSVMFYCGHQLGIRFGIMPVYDLDSYLYTIPTRIFTLPHYVRDRSRLRGLRLRGGGVLRRSGREGSSRARNDVSAQMENCFMKIKYVSNNYYMRF